MATVLESIYGHRLVARRNSGYDGLNEGRERYRLSGTAIFLLAMIFVAIVMLVIFSYSGNLNSHIVEGPRVESLVTAARVLT